MRNDKPTPRRLPKVPMGRRIYAFLIDFVTAWFISGLAGNNWFLQSIVFGTAWFGLRIALVLRNQGQSLGRWALDMRVFDDRFEGTPALETLVKREGIVGGFSLLTLWGLNINVTNGMVMLFLISPALANLGIALADETRNQGIHDRIAETIVIQTRRGFSLDLRLKELLDQLQDRMRQ